MCETVGFDSNAAWYILALWSIGIVALISYAVKKGLKKCQKSNK